MILGIGTDITSVERFINDRERMNRLAEKILTDYELLEYSKLQDTKSNFLAKRWAAKESISKAFNTGISGKTKWKSIEIRHKDTGSPYVCFYDELKRSAEVLGIRCHLSISDEGNIVVAYSVLEYDPNTKVLYSNYSFDNHA